MAKLANVLIVDDNPRCLEFMTLEQTQLQLNLGDSRFLRLVIPFVSAGQEAGRHDTSPVDGSA